MGRKNPAIKRAHELTEYTADSVQELLRCSTDPVYFIRNYVKIQHPVKGTVQFELYGYQEKLVKNFHENRLNIVLSARQTGKCCPLNTTVVTINKSNINIFKRLVLFLVNREVYNDIYKTM